MCLRKHFKVAAHTCQCWKMLPLTSNTSLDFFTNKSYQNKAIVTSNVSLDRFINKSYQNKATLISNASLDRFINKNYHIKAISRQQSGNQWVHHIIKSLSGQQSRNGRKFRKSPEHRWSGHFDSRSPVLDNRMNIVFPQRQQPLLALLTLTTASSPTWERYLTQPNNRDKPRSYQV